MKPFERIKTEETPLGKLTVFAHALPEGDAARARSLVAACGRADGTAASAEYDEPDDCLAYFCLLEGGPEGALAGFASCLLLRDEDGRVLPHADITLFVHPEKRRQGRARCLFDACVQTAEAALKGSSSGRSRRKASGRPRLQLCVSAAPTPASDACAAAFGLKKGPTEYILQADTAALAKGAAEPFRILPGNRSETVRLFSEIFSGDVRHPEEAIEEANEAGAVTYFLAADSGEVPLGMAQLLLFEDSAYLFNFGIRPGHRRQGFGGVFLARLAEKLSADGRRTLTLQVGEDNAAACAFYRQAGFTVLSEAVTYYR